jgi:hypothetical protein
MTAASRCQAHYIHRVILIMSLRQPLDRMCVRKKRLHTQ